MRRKGNPKARLCGVTGAAAILGLSADGVRWLIETGQLRAERSLEGQWLCLVYAVEMLHAQRVREHFDGKRRVVRPPATNGQWALHLIPAPKMAKAVLGDRRGKVVKFARKTRAIA